MPSNSVILHLCIPLRYLNQFQCLPHNIFTTYNSFYMFSETQSIFSTETHDNAIFSPPTIHSVYFQKHKAFFPQKLMTMQYFHTKSEKQLLQELKRSSLLILTATPLTVIRRLRLPSSNPSHWHTK